MFLNVQERLNEDIDAKSVLSELNFWEDKTMKYSELTLRNQGYVNSKTQNKIRGMTLLIAGCGVGSTIAEAVVRLGFEKFVLVDGDIVEPHNLNRQAFVAADVGEKKVRALARRLLAINPEAKVMEVDGWIDRSNVENLVSQADFILDTIDFLDLDAITALHDECHRVGKPIISGVSVGWGMGALYFRADPFQSICGFRTLFGLPEKGSVKNASYVEHFKIFMERVGPLLDPEVARAMAQALTIMEDGTPCPAPHVSAGSYGLGALVVTMLVRIIEGREVRQSPQMILVNLSGACVDSGIELTPDGDDDEITEKSLTYSSY